MGVMERENGNSGEDISLKDIISFIKLRFLRIFLRVLVSLIAVLVVIVLFYAYSPRSSSYKRNIVLLLQKPENLASYPSGKPFSSSDLISPLVLQEVYNNNNLKERIGFAKFCSFFAITDGDVRRDELDAEYRQKMTQKNISVVDLQNLERQYKQKLQTLSTDTLCITMSPQIGFSMTEAAKILNEIPETWFKIYSKLEAGQFPQIEANFLKQELSRQAGQPGYLILLEKTRVYCRQLESMCIRLGDMLQGKNVSLASGEFLGDVLNQLRSIDKYQISVFRQYVLLNPTYQGTLDKIFIYSNLQNIEQELIRVNTKYDSAVASIDILQAKTAASPNGMGSNGKPGNESGITLQLDNSFFNQFADMVRNDVNNTLRAASARKALELGEERANLEADKIYFQQLLNSIAAAKQVTGSGALNPEQFGALLKSMYADLFAVSEKVIQFRDKIVQDYLTSREFYVPIGNVQYRSESRFSISRFCIGMAALWILFNLIFVTVEFYQFSAKAKKLVH